MSGIFCETLLKEKYEFYVSLWKYHLNRIENVSYRTNKNI